MRQYLKLSVVVFFCFLGCSILVLGCKTTDNPLGHQGPFDVPTATSTITNTFTVTSTPTSTPTYGPVNVSCYVNYNGAQPGISWNLIDPSGNTLNPTPQSSGGTPFLFTPTAYGIYLVTIPAQTKYLYSYQPLTITSPANYSVTFSCTGQTISTNPNSVSYSSVIGYQMPITVSYSSSGNLNIPVSIQTSGLASSFSVSPSYVVLNNSSLSAPLTVTKNSCSVNNTSLNFSGYDLSGLATGATSSASIRRSYSIPVSFLASASNTSCGSLGNVFTITVDDDSLSCGPYSFSISNISNSSPQTFFSMVNSSTPAFLNIQNYDICFGINASEYSFTLPDGSVLSGSISSVVASNPGTSYVVATGSY